MSETDYQKKKKGGGYLFYTLVVDLWSNLLLKGSGFKQTKWLEMSCMRHQREVWCFTGRWSLIWETYAQMHLENGQWYLTMLPRFWNSASIIIPKIKLLFKAIIVLDKKGKDDVLVRPSILLLLLKWKVLTIKINFSIFVNQWLSDATKLWLIHYNSGEGAMHVIFAHT